ncbi:NAD-dependent epimerase [Mesobacillus campisalis]|uniref:NAD-dependent epimerase n=1 Tax=Mesobacillus campisalis TaxID=1408103 RepID=A0A0M2SXK4_9BACI|nr:NAD-dependent epimerase/dehydratase family protein [Mesobacillus campisalis]KKK38893.1 NAD-dependent epimerase [Mesobacillus campisalis]
MKKILITGKSGYIGLSLDKWLKNYPNKYSIDFISVRDDEWEKVTFSNYDVVFHAAGIAHIKETEKNADLYYLVNRDLSYQLAQKAKAEGVSQFIFLSSMSVYGVEKGVIDKSTPLEPKSHYGKSKLQAEKLITSIEDKEFKVAILRPPMIYGKGCKGNYPRLVNLALRLPFFPKINNKRSMIFIDNLCEFIRLLITDCSRGLYLPQNGDYVCTSEMVRLITEVNGKEIKMTELFNPIVRHLNVKTINKVFGDLAYEKTLSHYNGNYNLYDFKSSILLTERGEK